MTNTSNSIIVLERSMNSTRTHIVFKGSDGSNRDSLSATEFSSLDLDHLDLYKTSPQLSYQLMIFFSSKDP